MRYMTMVTFHAGVTMSVPNVIGAYWARQYGSPWEIFEITNNGLGPEVYYRGYWVDPTSIEVWGPHIPLPTEIAVEAEPDYGHIPQHRATCECGGVAEWSYIGPSDLHELDTAGPRLFLLVSSFSSGEPFEAVHMTPSEARRWAQEILDTIPATESIS